MTQFCEDLNPDLIRELFLNVFFHCTIKQFWVNNVPFVLSALPVTVKVDISSLDLYFIKIALEVDPPFPAPASFSLKLCPNQKQCAVVFQSG